MEDTFKVSTQNPYSNAGQATVNGFLNNLSFKPTVEELNRTISGSFGSGVGVVLENAPFAAVHPSVAGKRNAIRTADEESITLGPVQEIRPRQHANGRPLLRAKKK